jgi:hypothetical protein
MLDEPLQHNRVAKQTDHDNTAPNLGLMDTADSGVVGYWENASGDELQLNWMRSFSGSNSILMSFKIEPLQHNRVAKQTDHDNTAPNLGLMDTADSQSVLSNEG